MYLTLGRTFVREGGFGLTDPFLFTFSQFAWHVNHEWLSYLYYFALYSLGGFSLIIFFKALLVTSASALVFLSGRKSLLVGFLAFYVSAVRCFADRAAFFSDLFTCLLLFRMSATGRLRKMDYLAPFLFWLWIQLHPGFLLGLILLVGFIVIHWRNWPYKEKRLAVVIFFSVIAVLFLNPEGAAGVFYPIRLFFSPEWNIYREMNSEWVATWGHPLLRPQYKLIFYFFSTATLGVTALSAKRHGHWFSFFAALILVGLGLSGLRFLSLAGFGLGILLNREWGAFPDFEFFKKWRSTMQAIAGVGLLLWCGSSLASKTYGPSMLWERDPIHSSLPFKSARLFPHLPPGNIWNDFDLGGLLLWELDGRMKVAAHGHIDRPSLVLQNYNRWSASEADFHELIDGHQVEYFYLHRYSVTANKNSFWVQKLIQNWDLVYEDPQAVIFRRRPPK